MLSNAALKDPAMSGQLDYERVEGDFYATPPENVRCLLRYVSFRDRVVWEPACGEGHIAKVLEQHCRGVIATELFDRGYGITGKDFLLFRTMPSWSLAGGGGMLDATDIVTNPPYGNEAEKFVRHALDLTEPCRGRVAMFLRNEWDTASTGRADLFEGHPAYAMKIVVTKRPRWIEGSKGSPRHSYAWFVWDWEKPADRAPTIHYIHPRNA